MDLLILESWNFVNEYFNKKLLSNIGSDEPISSHCSLSIPPENKKVLVFRCRGVVMFYAIWYHLYNIKNVKNTQGGVLILVKLQPETCNSTKSNTPPWMFFTFLKFTNDTKSRNASQRNHWLEIKFLSILSDYFFYAPICNSVLGEFLERCYLKISRTSR